MSDLHRAWVIVLDGEPPAVELDKLRSGMKPAFAERVGPFQITRFE